LQTILTTVHLILTHEINELFEDGAGQRRPGDMMGADKHDSENEYGIMHGE
jgi:hypothetical protein